ncbi:MAG TPA: hypothetical protein VMO88_05655, partial [Acidimicrobiales bacterium]|nr:hypothetical protein [Acidimicrobiales bacterium]
SSKRYNLGALVLNKVLPEYLLDEEAERRARRLQDDAHELAASEGLAQSLGTERDQLGRVLFEVGENFTNFHVVARREATLRKELAVRPDVVATAPEFDADIHDLAGLLRLGEQIWS